MKKRREREIIHSRRQDSFAKSLLSLSRFVYRNMSVTRVIRGREEHLFHPGETLLFDVDSLHKQPLMEEENDRSQD